MYLGQCRASRCSFEGSLESVADTISFTHLRTSKTVVRSIRQRMCHDSHPLKKTTHGRQAEDTLPLLRSGWVADKHKHSIGKMRTHR